MNPEIFKSNFVLIYTTAAPAKASYRQGILDALCYPNEHIITYSYRRKRFEKDLQGHVELLTNKDGVIIFVNSDERRHATYYPLRRVRILSAVSDVGRTSPPTLDEYVVLSLKLGDFIDYSKVSDERQWHKRVEKFDDKRNIRQGIPEFFVIGGTDEFPLCPNSVPLAWESLVERVSRSSNFADAVFLRLGNVKPYNSEEKIHKIEHGRLVYHLRPATMYKLNLSIFEQVTNATSIGKPTALEIRTSAQDALVADQPFQAVVSGLAEKSTFITCKRTIENIIATLTVRVDHERVSSAIVNSPNPTLFVRISVSRGTLIGFLVSVVVGGFLVAVDSDILKELLSPHRPHFWALLSKGAGAALLGLAAYLAFRKLPSGEK